MNFVEGLIYPLVKSHFPQFYNEEGPRFVDFVKEYYRWMSDTNNALQISRSLQSLRDVDSTTDPLFVHFKEEFMNNLPVISEANKTLFLKHIINLYNAKGTEQGIQMLLRAMFNESAQVFYPGNQLLKSSDGVWFVPKYLELTVSNRSLNFIGKEIIGNQTGARAFVEKLVMQRIQGKYFNVAYLSGIRGDFITGERITESANTVLLNAPSVIGSLTSLDIITGGQQFLVGDTFDVISSFGTRGQARVTAVSNQTGVISFTLVDGGWGYTNTTSQVLISTEVISVTDVQNANAFITGFSQFETVTQNLRNMAYTSSSNSALFTVGSLIENYDGGGLITSNAVIVTSTVTNSSAGSLLICPISGAINSDATFSLRGNTTTGVISSFLNVTASGNVVGSNTTDVGVLSLLNQFVITPLANIIGGSSNTCALVANVSTGSQANFAVGTLKNIEQNFISPDFINANNLNGVPFFTINLNGNNAGYGNSSLGFPNYSLANTSAVILNVLRFQSMSLGEIASLININPGVSYNKTPFVVVLQKEIRGYNKHDYKIEYSGATGLFLNGEQITSNYNNLGVDLTVVSFSGTAANGTATSAAVQGEFIYQSNGSANIATGLVYSSVMAGGAGDIILVQNTGTFVTTTNSTLVLHSITTGATANITVVTPTNIPVAAKGFNKATSNSNVLRVKRVSMADGFITGQSITGVSSGTVANVVSVSPEDETLVIGINANTNSNVQTSNNAVLNVAISDSGFGYIENEVVSLSNPNTVFVISGKTHLGKQGIGTGFFTSLNGFLSDVNVLQDGEYYQDFSYEVQTKIPFNKYFDVLNQVVHLAGTKVFGRVISTSEISTQMKLESNTVIT